MNQLVLFLIAGAAFLLLFLVWLLKGQPKATEDALLVMAREELASLVGLASTKPDWILDDSDHRMLASNPALYPLARELRQDRRNITLLWLNLLRENVASLWRFRRLLVRNGVSVGLAEEVRIAITAVLALAYLSMLRGVVSVSGPFLLATLLRGGGKLVAATSGSCAEMFSRVPLTLRPEIERQWAAEFHVSLSG